MRRIALVCAVVLLATPAHAQLTVNDPTNLAKFKDLVSTAYDAYRTAQRQLTRLELMAKQNPNMERFRTKAVSIGRHDASRYVFGGPLLEGFNAGDARGVLYERTIQQIPTVAELAAMNLSATERKALEMLFGNVHIRDSFMQRGIHTVGANRVFMKDVERATKDLEDDIVRPANKEHYLAANWDKGNAARLLGLRVDNAVNQQIASIAEQQMAKTKRDRDAAAAWTNAQILNLAYGKTTNGAIQAGSGSALANWRMP